MDRQRRSGCPISFALDIFGDKWSLLILRDIIFKDKKYYQDFENSEEGISTNILADRLERLKCEGLIKGKADKANLRKIIYEPTAKALDLVPMLLEMIEWSAKYDPDTGTPKDFIQALKKNKKALVKDTWKKFGYKSEK